MSLIAQYRRYAGAIAGERLPLAIVDLDAVDANCEALFSAVRGTGKTLRLATKSVRCPAIIDHVLATGGELARGLMAFAVSEAELLVDRGATDVLVAYPTLQAPDTEALAALEARDGVTVSIVVDCEEHLDALDRAGRAAGVAIPVIVEVDMSLHAMRGRVHVGVRRSPLRTADDVLALARATRARDGVRFHGVMGYEAQIAGLGDANPFSRALNPVRRAIKRASVPVVAERREQVAAALRGDGFELAVFNGGGTGSLETTGAEDAVTEVTAGSGFLCSHLFDYYRHLDLEAAAFFALQVVRRPAGGVVTCHGGGLVASGESGPDRLPLPTLPAGLRLLSLEGAGEVQTPLTGPGTHDLALGDPVFFRHAKAGELAEHFNEYALVRGDRIVDRAPTYRGLGHRFL